MKRWKIVSGLLVLFLSGVATGVAGTVAVVHHRIQKVLEGGPLEMRKAVIERISNRLDLNESQKQAAATIIARAHEKIMAIRRRNQPEIHQIVEDAIKEMEPNLSPAQAHKLNNIKERFMNRWDPSPEGAEAVPGSAGKGSEAGSGAR